MDVFTFSRPKGLKIVSIVEMSAEFKYPFLKKIPTELFPQIELKEEYPLPKLCFERKNPKIFFYQFLSFYATYNHYFCV